MFRKWHIWATRLIKLVKFMLFRHFLFFPIFSIPITFLFILFYNFRGCFRGWGVYGPLRQYFSLYWSVSRRGRKKEEKIDERKNAKQPPSAPAASAIGPCPSIIQINRTPRHWKFTQHLRTTLHKFVINILTVLSNYKKSRKQQFFNTFC